MRLTDPALVLALLEEAGFAGDGYITLARIGAERKEKQVARLDLHEGVDAVAWLARQLADQTAGPDGNAKFRLRHHAPGGARLGGTQFKVEGTPAAASPDPEPEPEPILGEPEVFPSEVADDAQAALLAKIAAEPSLRDRMRPTADDASSRRRPLDGTPDGDSADRPTYDELARRVRDLEAELAGRTDQLLRAREDLAASRDRELDWKDRCHRADRDRDREREARLRAEAETETQRKARVEAEDRIEDLEAELADKEAADEVLSEQIAELERLMDAPKWPFFRR